MTWASSKDHANANKTLLSFQTHYYAWLFRNDKLLKVSTTICIIKPYG